MSARIVTPVWYTGRMIRIVSRIVRWAAAVAAHLIDQAAAAWLCWRDPAPD